MKLIYMTVAAVAIAAALSGCNVRGSAGAGSDQAQGSDRESSRDRDRASRDGDDDRDTASADAPRFPASCNISPRDAQGIPVLPVERRRGPDGPDYESLSTDDEQLPSGEYFDIINVNAERGQRLEIEVKGDGFEPRVILYDTNDCPWVDAVAARGGSAIINEEMDKTGMFHLLVTSSRAGATGRYDGSLNVTSTRVLD